MRPRVPAAAVDRLRQIVTRRIGLQTDDARAPELADALERRVRATRLNVDTYLTLLEHDPNVSEFAVLAPELTVSETYFFRHQQQHAAYTDLALPDRYRQAVAAGQRVHVLSAGCASGEEPYSLAIGALTTLGEGANAVSIVGADLNTAMIARAKQARFSAWSLRDTPPAVVQQWFHREGRDFVLDARAATAVQFTTANLFDTDSDLWRPESYDIVFCRNVLMYFAGDHAAAVVEGIARALRPGGYLFLGHAETLRGLSQAFHLRHTHGTFYYQRRDSVSEADDPVDEVAFWPLPASRPAEMPEVAPWIADIQRSADRIALLTNDDRPLTPAAPGDQARTRQMRLALDLLQAERFGDALGELDALSADAHENPDVLLLRAVLLTQHGRFAEAEQACHRLLARDELSAGAHYLLALCSEAGGDQAQSIAHDQTAVYLDPGFAMPHVHLGLLARRAGDRDAARRELEQAIALLRREDPSRLLMFGGGFSREALIALCRAELGVTGGVA